jgi:hypothetical protein
LIIAIAARVARIAGSGNERHHQKSLKTKVRLCVFRMTKRDA